MKKKNKKSQCIILFLLVLIGIVICGIMIFRNNKIKENSDLPTENITENYSKENKSQGDWSLIDMTNKENVEILNDIKINNSEKLLKDREFDGMKVTNIKLVAENGLTSFTANVENTSGKDFSERTITIVFKNQDGTEYGRLPGWLPDIKSGESSVIDANTTDDLSNSYDFTIE